MRFRFSLVLGLAITVCVPAVTTADSTAPQKDFGIRLGHEQVEYSFVESMADVEARARLVATDVPYNPKARNGAAGEWVVPSHRTTYFPKSGKHNVINKWGDTRMGIGFGKTVDVGGAFFAGQGTKGVWTTGVRALGYLNGQLVAVTPFSGELSETPVWLAMNFKGVDRIVIESEPVVADGAGWYSMDDLTFDVVQADGTVKTTVVDFEDAGYGRKLVDSNYAGLIWERGTGEFEPIQIMPPPAGAAGRVKQQSANLGGGNPAGVLRGGGGTAPSFDDEINGPFFLGAAGATAIPPDTCGAIGPNHFVTIVNSNISAYLKAAPHTRVLNQATSVFLPGSSGDGRVLFDQHSQRWIVLNTNFGGNLHLAVSDTDDPTGNWFKIALNVRVGADVNRSIDFPTLGVDQDGIYSSAFMVGATTNFSIFAIEKAPIVDMSTLGAATAFQNQTATFEGALQPVHTYGTPAGEYYVSRLDVNNLRIRRVDPPLNAPTVSTLGDPAIPFHLDPPDAPSLGSGINIDTGDARISHTPFYRDGAIYAAHTINNAGRAAVRWYVIDEGSLTVTDSGTIDDPNLYFYYGHMAVNVCGDLVLGFSGSDANQFVGAYFTGRRFSDPAGQTAPPFQYEAGLNSYTLTDGFGRNRWGDYSAVSVDPSDEQTFWNIQEYARTPANRWGTRIAVLSYPSCVGATDCNSNGVDDATDISGATSEDCNNNAVPDECDVAGATSNDCNGNSIPDECELAGNDCNNNGVPDDCELSGNDCNNNGTPDDCELVGNDCNNNGTPDDCELVGNDCNTNGTPDDCDVAVNDCNQDGTPDDCQLGLGDCNANGVLDTCEFAGNECADPIVGGEPLCADTDVNCDGATNALDLADIQAPQNWAFTAFLAVNGRADVNGDCVINALDLAQVQSPLNWASSTGPCRCCE